MNIGKETKKNKKNERDDKKEEHDKCGTPDCCKKC